MVENFDDKEIGKKYDAICSAIKKISNKFKARILVVDDNEINLEVAVGMLELLGCDVDTASGGEEAIRKFEENENYDIVFMDIMMPDIDGFKTTESIREMSKRKRKNPVIIGLSANIFGKDDIEKCLTSGMNDCIVKPVKSVILETRLQKWKLQNGLLKNL